MHDFGRTGVEFTEEFQGALTLSSIKSSSPLIWHESLLI